MTNELNLPEGWEVKTLGDIAKINYGYTEKASFDEIGPKFLRITDIQDNGVEWSKVPFCKCSESDLPKYKLETGDIVFARTGATTGKSYLLNNPQNSVFASYLIRLKLISKNDFVPEFISYYFQTKAYWDKINAGISGSAQGGFNASKLGELLFSFPKSVTEQKRIVAILDEAFESIVKAKENAEKNLKNANDIFESYLQSVFDNKGEGWEEKTLGETCIVKRGSSPRPIKKYITSEDDGVNWVKIGDTKEVKKYIYTTEQKITPEGALKSRFVDVGDFILSNSMSFGKSYIMKTQGYIHDGWFVLRLPQNIDNEFFWYLLASPYTMNQFTHLASGAIVKNISGDLVKKTILPIPPLKEQKRIVTKLDALSTETKKLEAINTQKLADLEELKKLILQKAFNGELTEASV